MGNERGQTGKMIAVLTIVSALSGLLLSVFYGWINPIVESRKEREMVDLGLHAIFPVASHFSPVDLDGDPDGIVSPVYEVFNEAGQSLGYFFNATGEGWNPFEIAVGVDLNTMSVIGVRVMDHAETPGLGSHIEDDWFLDQFALKPLSDPFQAGIDVDMITGATVSTAGMARAISTSAHNLIVAAGFHPIPTAETTPIDGPTTMSPRSSIEPSYETVMLALIGDDTYRVDESPVWEIVDEATETRAVALRIIENGFGGPVEVMVVVDAIDQTVIGVEVLDHNETPTLGDQIEHPHFLDQFKGKGPTDVGRVFTGIDGITAATESSKAVTDAIERAIMAVDLLYGERSETH